jgi:hypothetical protein
MAYVDLVTRTIEVGTGRYIPMRAPMPEAGISPGIFPDFTNSSLVEQVVALKKQ